MPHYDWLFYVKIFSPLPFWWLLPQILVSFPALLITFYYARDSWIIAVVSVLGGIYPDIEKLAYVDFHLPQYFVLFRNHSCALSQWTPWELEHKTFLIVFEVCLFLVLLVGICWAARCRKQLRTEILWYKNKETCHCERSEAISLDSLNSLPGNEIASSLHSSQ
jgi:hypothetical protein